MARQSKSKARSKKQSPDWSELLIMELQQIQSAETQLMRTLPRLANAVQSDKLREMIELRQEQGETLIEQLDNAFEQLEERPGRRKNAAIEGLINDAREHMQEIQPGPALDEVLLASIQKIEHYCIAAWGTAKALADAIGVDAVVEAMDDALENGKDYDQELTKLSERELIPALQPEEEDDADEQPPPRSSRKGTRSERRQSA